jgi:hypothetical protein
MTTLIITLIAFVLGIASEKARVEIKAEIKATKKNPEFEPIRPPFNSLTAVKSPPVATKKPVAKKAPAKKVAAKKATPKKAVAKKK